MTAQPAAMSIPVVQAAIGIQGKSRPHPSLSQQRPAHLHARAGDTLSIDTGEYPLLSPLVVSNSVTVGDDEGFLMRGAAIRDSQLSHANPLTIAPVLTLIDADLMTVNHLQLVGGTMGLSVRDGSNGFNADRVRSLGATQRGMLIDSGSSVSALSRLLVDGSLGRD